MAGPQRPASGLPTRKTGLRQPTRRPRANPTERTPSTATLAPSTSARSLKSPSEQSTGAKRNRDYERNLAEDTSIHVVVRCRGRTEREVKENSGVAVSTEGVKGKAVELSMGPGSIANKAYNFDKVFSPAADQGIFYEDVVAPILNEMLAGFNCTIFAYGQTGTGKTYTMSGDMTDTLGILSDNAGVVPRVLYSLFHKLEDTESVVKCSFIELYNEELKDLLSAEESAKLKIYDNESKKGHGSTLVQGMEETYIDSASAGIKLLQQGSIKRQVAATKCNDLSSRSHTVFTITVQTKRTTESGEEYITSGKLNLVDLAGSENIQRSGAENKRAAEAGLINKSLLTLGRVINALVDKNQHIPYRESKLTRLLQDSLGGRTKTCIIATVSTARTNLDETISTLDYAFRAKDIRNKPQTNPTSSKKTLLREFTTEIEKLKSELIATRHRNGVYMPPESYEEMTMESESRRIVSEEQRAKIEAMESSLRHKVQELFTLTSKFNNLRVDNEETRNSLNETNDVLHQTEIVVMNTRKTLEEEEMLRKAHEDTELQLHGIGTELLSTLDKTVGDVNGLHDKVQRKADLHLLNRNVWQTSTTEVTDVTKQVDNRIEAFQVQHLKVLGDISNRINGFVNGEMSNVRSSRSQLEKFTKAFDKAESEAKTQTSGAHDEMNEVLEEIKFLREEVKAKVGEGLNGLSAAAARISKEVIGEFAEFQSQLHSSYSSLGNDFKFMFGHMASHIDSQKTEIDQLRLQLQKANRDTVEANRKASSHMAHTLEEEHLNAESEHDILLSQIRSLMEESRQKQFGRLRGRFDGVRNEIMSSSDTLEQATAHHDRQVDEWVFKEEQFKKDVTASQEGIHTKMQNDWESFDQRNESIHRATESVHGETVRIVDAQMKDMSKQMEALDDFVTKARSQNGLYHDAHLNSLNSLSTNVRQSYTCLNDQMEGLGGRVGKLQGDFGKRSDSAQKSIAPLSDEVRKALSDLGASMNSRQMKEYEATGKSPQKRNYDYPATLPRTEPHEALLSRMKNAEQLSVLPFSGVDQLSPVKKVRRVPSPSKSYVHNDGVLGVGKLPPPTTPTVASSSNKRLRELDANVVARPTVDGSPVGRRLLPSTALGTPCSPAKRGDRGQPPLKRHCPASASVVSEAAGSKLQKRSVTGIMDTKLKGRENIPPSTPSGSGQ